MDKDTAAIIAHLLETGRGDFRGCNPAMLDRRISRRCAATGMDDKPSYGAYLAAHPEEADELLNALTIHVSGFFREPLAFDYIEKVVLPDLVHRAADRPLRIWSAGCAQGEEAFSIAILLHEIAQSRQQQPAAAVIVATDLSATILQQARIAVYPPERVAKMRFGLVKKYFTLQDDQFVLAPEIRDMVTFESFDLLDPQRAAPGDTAVLYDLIMCSNVLIYFNPAYQAIIFDKLYRALALHGYLVLGETEAPPSRYDGLLQRISIGCRAYHKIR